jgi:DNA primase
MEKLEDFIRHNREGIDQRDPSPEVWKGIRRNLHRRRSGVMERFAAAAIIIVVVTAAVFQYTKGNKDGSLNHREALLMKNNPQLRETEFYYNNLINSLYNEVVPQLTGYPDIRKEFLHDMSQIDSICTDIKKDLKDNVSNQEVIEALINNYRIKIQILEEMLDQLRQNENIPLNKESHEL